MAAPALTYTLTNGTTADASQVMQNFNDLLNGIIDGTKDLSISALTCAGTATLNGHVNLGNSSADDLTVTASLASNLAIKTNNTYGIGSSTLGLSGIYLGNGGAGATCRVISASHSAARTYTIPDAGADADIVVNKTVQTFYDGIILDDAAGQSTLNFFKTGTWTPVVKEGSNTLASTASGYYARIGNTVIATYQIDNITKSGTGTLTITGLPYATAKITVGTLHVRQITYSAGEIPIAQIPAGSDVIGLIRGATASNGNVFTASDLNAGNSSDIYGTLIYDT